MSTTALEKARTLDGAKETYMAPGTMRDTWLGGISFDQPPWAWMNMMRRRMRKWKQPHRGL